MTKATAATTCEHACCSLDLPGVGQSPGPGMVTGLRGSPGARSHLRLRQRHREQRTSISRPCATRFSPTGSGSPRRVLPSLPGLRRPGAIRLALEHHTAPRRHQVEVIQTEGADLRGAAPTIPFFPGAPELVRAWPRMPLAIASRAPPGDRGDPHRGALRDSFRAIVGPTTWRRGKQSSPISPPRAPASGGPRLRPEECVAFEDSMPASPRRGPRDEGRGRPAATPREMTAAHRVVASLQARQRRLRGLAAADAMTSRFLDPQDVKRQKVPVRLRPSSAGRKSGAGAGRRGRPRCRHHGPPPAGGSAAGGRLQARPRPHLNFPAEAPGRVRRPGASWRATPRTPTRERDT
jgi:hypothetical protein